MRRNALRATLVAPLLLGGCGSEAPVAVEVDPRWSLGVRLPEGLTGVAAATFEGNILVAGGETENGPSARVYRFRPGATAWERLADLPDVRVGGHLVVVDGVLHLVGGDHRPGVGYYPDRRLFRYEAAADRWVEHAPFPDLRAGDAVAIPGGIVVVGGGFGDPDHGGVYPGDSAVVYDLGRDAWRYAAPLRVPRIRPLAVSVGSVVHVFGGTRLDALGTPRDIEIYDAAQDRWRTADAQFVDYGLIGGQAHARVGDGVHFLGGVYALPGSPVIETHFRYDLETGALDVLPALPTARAHAAAVALDGRLYVIGGLRGARNLPGAFTPIVEVFDAR